MQVSTGVIMHKRKGTIHNKGNFQGSFGLALFRSVIEKIRVLNQSDAKRKPIMSELLTFSRPHLPVFTWSPHRLMMTPTFVVIK